MINELDTVAGGCVLCHEVDFQRGGFGPRTVLFCDQCEREFHVGCLKKAGKCDLQEVPEGNKSGRGTWVLRRGGPAGGSYVAAEPEFAGVLQHVWLASVGGVLLLGGS